MFTILIFLEFRIDIAGFWEMGQLGSIYSSAIVSLIMYHYLSEQLNKENIDDKNVLSEQRDSFQLIVDSIQEGIIIVQDGKIEYMNTIFNNIMSQVYEIKNFFKESFRKSIIDEFDLLDIKVFKLYKESDQESSISKLLNMSNRTDQQ
jgi:PAS domain-containing protein